MTTPSIPFVTTAKLLTRPLYGSHSNLTASVNVTRTTNEGSRPDDDGPARVGNTPTNPFDVDWTHPVVAGGVVAPIGMSGY